MTSSRRRHFQLRWIRRRVSASGAAAVLRCGCSDGWEAAPAHRADRPHGSRPWSLADCTRLITIAARWPPTSLPHKSSAGLTSASQRFVKRSPFRPGVGTHCIARRSLSECCAPTGRLEAKGVKKGNAGSTQASRTYDHQLTAATPTRCVARVGRHFRYRATRSFGR